MFLFFLLKMNKVSLKFLIKYMGDYSVMSTEWRATRKVSIKYYLFLEKGGGKLLLSSSFICPFAFQFPRQS